MTTAMWTVRDRRLLVARLGAGVVVIAVAWYLAAGKADPADQLPFASLTVVGGLLGMYAVFAWVGRGRRAIGERARLLLGTAPGASTDVASAETLVAGGSRAWFHRADCLLAVSRSWPAAARSVHEAAGRRPCPACKP